MIVITEKSNCCGCSACVSICPESCIVLQVDHEGFAYPRVDFKKCSQCRLCLNVCPILQKTVPREPLVVYAAINKDNKVRQNSSSGGIFWELGKSIIESGGIVFGVGWSNDLRVVHKCVNCLEEMKELQGSKYVQSDMGDTFASVRNYLILGRKVLFSGTPCQVSGLRFFLGREYENLLCIDFVCHAVPSPKVFEVYKRNLEQKYKSIIKKISFRDKKHGWRKFSMSIFFENNVRYLRSVSKDPFLVGFLNELYNRPSCHNCRFRDLRSGSDITFADFWGVENIMPSFSDDRGISLVFVNSQEGQQAFDKASESLSIELCEYEKVRDLCRMFTMSTKAHRNRDAFFVDFNTSERSVSVLVDYYAAKTVRQRVGEQVYRTAKVLGIYPVLKKIRGFIK